METNIEILTHEEFGQIRIIQESDRCLFCGLDIAKALGYANLWDAIRRHCKDHDLVKREVVTKRAGRWGSENETTENMIFVAEGNVYRLIVHSKLPAAEKFDH